MDKLLAAAGVGLPAALLAVYANAGELGQAQTLQQYGPWGLVVLLFSGGAWLARWLLEHVVAEQAEMRAAIERSTESQRQVEAALTTLRDELREQRIARLEARRQD